MLDGVIKFKKKWILQTAHYVVRFYLTYLSICIVKFMTNRINTTLNFSELSLLRDVN